MSITREERTELHDLVRAAMGDRLADLLMAGLDTGDLAAMEERLTLRIENSRLELRGEMADLRGELKGEMADLRGEFRDLHGEFGQLRGQFGELRGQFGELRGEMTVGFAELRAEMAERSRSTFIAVFTANAAVAGLVLAALQIVT